MYSFLIGNNLFYKYQSGFLPHHSTVVQLIDIFHNICQTFILGHVAHCITCLAADRYLTVDRGIASSIPARSHTLVEIYSEIILWPFSSLPLIQEALLSVTNESMCTKYWLTA